MVVPSSLEVLCDAYIKVWVGILGSSFVDDVTPLRGQSLFLEAWKLHSFSVVVFFFFFSFSTFLLCSCNILFMLAVQLYEILRVFLFNIGYNLWCLGKCLLTRSKNFFQI